MRVAWPRVAWTRLAQSVAKRWIGRNGTPSPLLIAPGMTAQCVTREANLVAQHHRQTQPSRPDSELAPHSNDDSAPTTEPVRKSTWRKRTGRLLPRVFYRSTGGCRSGGSGPSVATSARRAHRVPPTETLTVRASCLESTGSVTAAVCNGSRAPDRATDPRPVSHRRPEYIAVPHQVPSRPDCEPSEWRSSCRMPSDD